MSIHAICTQEVVKINKTASVSEAIKLMRNKHVGNIVIIDNDNIPVGILTDRDIVIKILFNDVEPDSLSVGDAMSADLVTVPASTSILEALGVMRVKGVRRAPVVDDRDDHLVGIITVDDIIGLLAEELGEIALLIKHERKHESMLSFGQCEQ